MKIKQFTLHNDTYDFDLLVQRGGLVKDLHTAYFEKVGAMFELNIADSPGRKGNFITLEGRRNGAIWLRHDVTLPVIAHETFHATVSILGQYGMTLNDGSEEAYAYLQQWMITNILRKI